MADDSADTAPGAPGAFRSHPRTDGGNLYVYPVLSRRARGVSIGINLNPDKICNFDCIYCQVDRRAPAEVRRVDEARLRAELQRMLRDAASGALFARPEFAAAPEPFRRLRDITFAGDGEPPSYPNFAGVMRDVIAAKRALGFPDLKVIVLTNATLIDRPRVREALRLLDEDHGELWLKLDAGSEAYYHEVDRTTLPFAKVLENIAEAARARPIVLQSMFMKIRGAGPSRAEIDAFCGRVRDVVAAGGRVRLVQVYTVARRPAEEYVTPLERDEVDAIAAAVRAGAPVAVEAFYSDGPG